jgi:hypothetical protein
MITNARPKNGLDPLLLPDRDEPYRLFDVFEKIVYGCRQEIILDLGDSFLRFGVDPDTDSITAQFQGRPFGSKRGYRSMRASAPWSRFLNEECGWTWLAVNQQGYWDSILLSFEAVVPNILLNVMASSIYVFTIGPMEKIAVKRPRNSKATVTRITKTY